MRKSKTTVRLKKREIVVNSGFVPVYKGRILIKNNAFACLSRTILLLIKPPFLFKAVFLSPSKKAELIYNVFSAISKGCKREDVAIPCSKRGAYVDIFNNFEEIWLAFKGEFLVDITKDKISWKTFLWGLEKLAEKRLVSLKRQDEKDINAFIAAISKKAERSKSLEQ